MIAYSIASAQESGLFQRIVVSTDSAEYAEIARYYGAETPFLRPAEFATSTSPDIEWINHALDAIGPGFDALTILRPTSPFRSATTIHRAWQRLRSLPGVDSVRAVEKVRQHPGKTWVVSEDRDTMRPLLDQSHLKVAWHAGQYQALPEVYVQNSSLEIAWIEAIRRTGTREGKVFAPFFTEGFEGFAFDYEDEWHLAQKYLEEGRVTLPRIDKAPFALPA